MSLSLGRRRTLAGVVVATVLALLLRFYELGWRVFHWDEGRVGYWILRYLETGVWEYRPIVHGPFLFQVNRQLFALFGVTDFVARAPVALVGGLLPLTAWLLRDRLRDIEVVAVAGFLALNPILLYYSRFMRNDVLVGGFALFAFAFTVRALDTGRRGYLVPAGIALGLAFTAKENALLYVVSWLGGVAFLFDHRLVTARSRGDSWTSVATTHLRDTAAALWSWRPAIVAAVFSWLAIVVVFYAPRPAFGDPGQLLFVLDAATIGAGEDLVGQWISGGLQKHSYIEFLRYAVEDALAVSLPVFVFGLGGFLLDRYAGERPRDLVAFCGFWAIVSFFGYPAAVDLAADWSLVHAVLPMTIPAGVGIAAVVDRAVAGAKAEDGVAVALAALVLLAVVAQVGVTAVNTSYRQPQADTNPLVQYGQPGGHVQEKLDSVMRLSRENGGTDVLFVGEHFYVADETAAADYVGVPGGWFNRLPLPWYLERADAQTASVQTPSRVDSDDAPPVVVARAEHYPELNPRLSGYEPYTFQLTASDVETVIWVDESRVSA
jgi:uncharacterized protein (TIGR03663 family)